jgi:hypothetical protein
LTEPLLLAAAPIATFLGPRLLTRASGFFYESADGLFLVTCRHVLIDEESGHLPDRLEFDFHIDSANLTRSATLSLLLYRDGHADWRQAADSAGDVDVAAIAIDRTLLPSGASIRAFTPAHLPTAFEGEVEVGDAVLVVGFPLGFRDTVHHLPVVRQAVIASSFGVRFQGRGFFLTDARTHRGTSGAAVVMRARTEADKGVALPWRLLGVHSGRLELLPRDTLVDDFLGLNCTWYADVLRALTGPVPEPAAVAREQPGERTAL